MSKGLHSVAIQNVAKGYKGRGGGGGRKDYDKRKVEKNLCPSTTCTTGGGEPHSELVVEGLGGG